MSGANYQARFRKVLDHIDAHLNESLTVEELSGIAAFSKHHFHRQFSALLGVPVSKYIQLRRLKRASYQLAFRSNPILEVALTNGYEGPESFARAFKKEIGQSPSDFRRAPQWTPWNDTLEPLNELRKHPMSPAPHPEHVSIVSFPATPVAVLEHRGDPTRIGDSIRRFIAWRRQHRLPPQVSATFNLAYDDPESVAPEDYRMDLCAATDMAVLPNELGVMSKTIPAGRCALLRHVGSDDTLRDSVLYLYSQWLPQSGEELREFPLYFQRVTFFPDVPEHEAITDVFLPLK